MGKKRKNKRKASKVKAKAKAEVEIEETEDLGDFGGRIPENEDPLMDTLDEICVEIDEEVYAKVMHWVDKADGEVSGLGKIQLINGVFRVTSAILLKQENTGVSTDIEGPAVGKAMFELKDEPGTLNWWWHSHVNMEVFWSGTDLDTIHKIGAGGWFLSTVFNKKRDMLSAYYQKGNGFLPGIFVDKLHTSTILSLDETKTNEWDKDFEAKVTEKKYNWTETSHLPGGPSPRSYPSYWGAEEYDWRTGSRGESRFNDVDDDDRGNREDGVDLSEEDINEMVLQELRERQDKKNVRFKKRKNII